MQCPFPKLKGSARLGPEVWLLLTKGALSELFISAGVGVPAEASEKPFHYVFISVHLKGFFLCLSSDTSQYLN